MKKLLMLVMVWYIFTNASEKTDKWIVVYQDETTTVKVKREDYLEHQEFMEEYAPKRKFEEDMDAYIEWETKIKYKEFRLNQDIKFIICIFTVSKKLGWQPKYFEIV